MAVDEEFGQALPLPYALCGLNLQRCFYVPTVLVDFFCRLFNCRQSVQNADRWHAYQLRRKSYLSKWPNADFQVEPSCFVHLFCANNLHLVVLFIILTCSIPNLHFTMMNWCCLFWLRFRDIRRNSAWDIALNCPCFFHLLRKMPCKFLFVLPCIHWQAYCEPSVTLQVYRILWCDVSANGYSSFWPLPSWTTCDGETIRGWKEPCSN